MKRLFCLAFFVLLSVPGWSAAKKITVAELRDMMQSMHNDKKSDADVAFALKQVILTEQLTRGVMNGLAEFAPGQEATEQIYVLEARSAVLPPPAADIPTTPAPDDATQKALLAKAAAYASATYDQLPALTATKTTLRFQDNIEALASSSGLVGSGKDVSTGSAFVHPSNFVRYINSTDVPIGLQRGIERLPATKNMDHRMTWIVEPPPGLAQVFKDATDSGTLKFARWEDVNGKPAAVFTFQVAKKKGHLAMHVCCFPDVDATGKATFTSATLAGPGGTPGASGNFQTNTDWHPYKQTGQPYHGSLFVNPETGIVVRMITQMEPKTTDVVHQQDTRIDYAPTTVGDKTLVLPMSSIVISEVVPNGDSGAGGFSTRCTLLSSQYKDYALAK